jgi:predicted nucleotidyltransferase component of viral defense system
MDILEKHEVFEIEVLDRLNSAKLLDPLVFGGGTMLRLCHELNRYSVDLDFWFVRKTAQKVFLTSCLKTLARTTRSPMPRPSISHSW